MSKRKPTKRPTVRQVRRLEETIESLQGIIRLKERNAEIDGWVHRMQQAEERGNNAIEQRRVALEARIIGWQEHSRAERLEKAQARNVELEARVLKLEAALARAKGKPKCKAAKKPEARK